VALLDISGSMSQYTRLFLHFLHAMTDARKRVHTFLFGTRLTNVTRALREKDPDEALAACSASVLDWSGGTRIATSLHEFNKQWSRRVLGQGAVVLLFTDGLERDGERLGVRDRPAAPLLPAAGLAQSAAALRRLRGARRRASGPCCRMSTNSADPQSRLDADLCRALSAAWPRQPIRRLGWLERNSP
jgi:hypothetical protein